MSPASRHDVPLSARLDRPGGILCLVSDRRMATLDVFRAAVAAGVDLIQIREPDLDGGALVALTRAVVDLARGSQTLVVVNDRADAALAAGADGVHLRSDSFAAAPVRALAGRPFLVGRSIHSEAEAADHGSGVGADYMIFGTVFPSARKPEGHPVAGLAGLAAACARSAVPVLAIGGMSVERASDVAAAGAAGVAGIGLFCGTADVAGTVRTLRAAFPARPHAGR
jgi:thiamine-phosphate pyrophosphorylase